MNKFIDIVFVIIKAFFIVGFVGAIAYLLTLLTFWIYLHTVPPLKIEAYREPVNRFSSLVVQNSDSTQLQPVQAMYEDETVPSMTVQPTMLDNELQHMKHYAFLQDTTPQMMLQPIYDVTLAEHVTLVSKPPLIIYETLEVDGLIKL